MFIDSVRGILRKTKEMQLCGKAGSNVTEDEWRREETVAKRQTLLRCIDTGHFSVERDSGEMLPAASHGFVTSSHFEDGGSGMSLERGGPRYLKTYWT